MSIIYCIQNQINNKKYIGQSKYYNSNKEFQKSGYWGSGKLIQKAIKKYGLENFKKWVLLHCKNEESNHYEKLWLRKLKTKVPKGYNLLPGGNSPNGMIGRKHSIETKKIMSIKKKEWWRNNTKKIVMDRKSIGIQISKKLKGRIFTKEWKEKIRVSKLGKSPWNFGMKMNEQYGINVSNGLKNYYQTHSAWNKGKSIPGVPHSKEWCKHISEGKKFANDIKRQNRMIARAK